MKYLKNILKIWLVAVVVAVAVPAKSQTYVGGIISTGAVSVTSPSTNTIIDVSKPPSQFTGTARDNSWFELGKDRGLAIQVAVGGTLTNCTIVFEASNDPNNRTNWTNNRFLTFNMVTAAGVMQSNVPSSALLNTRAVRPYQILGTNGAGSFVVTNIHLGYWK